MKNENEIKRAFAMEVIEKLTDKAKSCQTMLYDGLCESVKIVQSLLPKEEDTKTESDEVKMPYFVGWELTENENGIKMATLPAQSLIDILAYLESIRKTEPTLEQKARKKAEEIRKSQTTFLHQNGDKVELELTEIHRFSFETQFGYCSIVTYQNKEGQIYKYKGGTPPNINDLEYSKVKCTIKHAD